MSDTEQRHDATLDDEIPAPVPQTRGLIDGSLNNANVLSGANILGAMVNSKIEDNSNNDANTRAAGKSNSAIND